MNKALFLATVLLVLLAALPSARAQSADDGMREQFEAVIDGLNNNTFREFHDAIDDDELMGRIFGAYVLDGEAKQSLRP
ncbi:MAG: hypothetical protein OEU53_04690, partial [Gammaproteobacteria bacterium]|nr:hypothetical protein [Gammaproteobacteria bacterium]